MLTVQLRQHIRPADAQPIATDTPVAETSAAAGYTYVTDGPTLTWTVDGQPATAINVAGPKVVTITVTATNGTYTESKTFTREVADSKLDHEYKNYTSNNDATCTANGTETGTCVCGKTHTREGVVVDIKENGEISAETFGFQGASCMTELDKLLKGLAMETVTEKKPEFFDETRVTDNTITAKRK